MRADTGSSLHDYYAHLFGIDRSDLWCGVSVRRHGGRLEDYEGYYVVARGDGVHVSVPPSEDDALVRSLAANTADVVRNPSFWEAFAATRALRVIGPSTHMYLDVDPGRVDGVVRATWEDLRALRALVGEADWDESGWDDQPEHTFGVYEDGVVVAASNLNAFHLQPRDVGVLVAPGWRGRGLSERVGRHAASYAIRQHGFARWGAQNTNVASLAASRRLGFEPWCSQLAVR
jgi:GNAT superfamily N-acetyltransferase